MTAAVPANWIDGLEGAPAVLEVPSDHPRGLTSTDPLAVEALVAPTALVRAIDGFAQSLDAPRHAVVLAGWSALLSRYTAQEQVVVGVTTAIDDTVDVSLSEVGPVTGLAQLVEARRSAAGGAGAGFTLAELVSALGIEPSASKHPVFQVGLAVGVADLAVEQAPEQPAAHPHPDLTLMVDDREPTLRIRYRQCLFEPDRIRRMLQHLVTLLAEALADPQRPVASIGITTADEHGLLNAWNDTARPVQGGRAPLHLFEAQVQATPDAIALEFDDDTLTYAELDRRAADLASELVALGVGPDVRVALSIERSFAMIVAILAVMKAGGAYVPVDPEYPEHRRQYMIADAQVAAVLRGPTADGGVSIEPATTTRAPHPVGDEPAVDERLCYVIYTSGSTGEPKGVALPNAALVNLLEWQRSREGFRPGARTLQFTSLSFDVSFQEIFSTLVSGGTLVMVPDSIRRNPLTMLDAMIRRDVERLFLPFVALRGLANAACTTGRFPRRLQEVYTAGEQLQVDDTLRRFFDELPDALLENQYGPTEAAVIVTAYTMAERRDRWQPLPPIGAPIANVHMYTLDPMRRAQPIGVPGDLFIAGACLARGYLGKPELTADRFVDITHDDGSVERAYRSGDLARWLANGQIEFLGRADNQVKFRGYRIEPGEVGAALSNHPDVEQCMATIRQVEDSGPRLVAYVKPRANGVNLEEVHRFARTVLPEHMVPSHFAVVDEFPLTPSGKIDMKALPTPEFNREILGVGYQGPRTSAEIRLARIWSQLLGVAQPGIHDDFFVLGGDSLMAVEMFAMIRDEFDRDLPLGALAAAPTIAELATRLGGPGADDFPLLVPMQTKGSKPPLFCVHGGSGNVATFPLLARGLPADQPFYALQWDGLDGSLGTRNVPDMAAMYLREVRRVRPTGPYLLAGQCAGGIIAQEMARVLHEQGERVDLVVMYDSPHLFSPHYVPPSLQQRVVRAVRFKSMLRFRSAVGVSRRHLHARIRRRVTTDWFRPIYAADVIAGAIRRHRPSVPPVPTLLFSTAETNATTMGLPGRWTDDALGWSPFESPLFEIHQIRGGHTQIMYFDEAIQIVRAAIDHSLRRDEGVSDDAPGDTPVSEPVGAAQ